VVWAILRIHQTAAAAETLEHVRASVIVFLLSASFCFGASAIAHTLAPLSKKELSLFLWRVDYYGIAVLIAGSWVPGLEFGYSCRRHARHVYQLIITGLLLMSGWACASSTPLRNRLRTPSLCLSAGFGIVPLGHFCFFANTVDIELFVLPVLKMFTCYGVGVVFFLTAFPECVRPGAFDLTGGSHFVWHLSCLAAVYFYDVGVQRMQELEVPTHCIAL
jgi:adiponectin receptor